MAYYSMASFVNEAYPSPAVLDYIIRTKYTCLIIINHERNAKVLLLTKNYSGIREENGVYYISSKKPITINNFYPISVFEVDIAGGDDVLGFLSTEEANRYCEHKNINTSSRLTSKLIFSPQLANYLLERGYTITHLKPHRGTGQPVYVFNITTGFYEAINDYRHLNESAAATSLKENYEKNY